MNPFYAHRSMDTLATTRTTPVSSPLRSGTLPCHLFRPSGGLCIGLFTLLVVAPFLSTDVVAQMSHLNTRNHGLGGGGTAYTTSYHANFVNPANLMFTKHMGVRRAEVEAGDDGTLVSDSAYVGRGLESRDSAWKQSAFPVSVPATRFHLGLIGNVNSMVGGELANISIYNQYLTTGDVIRPADVDNMLDGWFGTDYGVTKGMDTEINVIPIGLYVRGDKWAASIAVRSRTFVEQYINRGVAELFFLGLDADNFSSPKLVNLGMRAISFSEVSLGYAMEIGSLRRQLEDLTGLKETRLYVGVAPKLILGHAMAKVDLESSLQVGAATAQQGAFLNHDILYTMQTAGPLSGELTRYIDDRDATGEFPDVNDYLEVGTINPVNGIGVGLDFGATFEANVNPWIGIRTHNDIKILRVALSFTDIGAVRFSQNVAGVFVDEQIRFNGLDYDQELIDEQFDGVAGDYFTSVLQDSIGNGQYLNLQKSSDTSLSESLPAAMHLGGQLILGRLSTMLDLGLGFNSMGVNSQRPSLALGVEYLTFNVLPIRLGMKLGGYGSASYHFGTGIDTRNFELTFSTSLSPNTSTNGVVAGITWSGLVFRF